MKKPYVAPESYLFSINLSENIAASDLLYNGDDEISATAVIKFTSGMDPCREVYTERVPVSPEVLGSSSFLAYYNDLSGQVSSGVENGLAAYFNCFKYVSNV